MSSALPPISTGLVRAIGEAFQRCVVICAPGTEAEGGLMPTSGCMGTALSRNVNPAGLEGVRRGRAMREFASVGRRPNSVQPRHRTATTPDHRPLKGAFRETSRRPDRAGVRPAARRVCDLRPVARTDRLHLTSMRRIADRMRHVARRRLSSLFGRIVSERGPYGSDASSLPPWRAGCELGGSSTDRPEARTGGSSDLLVREAARRAHLVPH